MNDTPDSEAPRLVSRRTVAKTAAWAAPAIALAAASPAHAASAATSTGVIYIPQRIYFVQEGSAFPIEGTLTPAEGGTLPANFRLQVEGADGFRVLTEPAIVYTDNGITFSFFVSALRTGAAEGVLTVSSNYPATSWAPDATTLRKNQAPPLPEGSPRIFFSWEDQYYTVAAKNDGFTGFHTVTGQIRVPEGTKLPADMKVKAQTATDRWNVVGAGDDGVVLDVTPEGIFSFDVVQRYDNSHFGFFEVVWMSPQIPQSARCIVGDWTKPKPDDWNAIKPEGWDDLWG
ncbi:hypothetical protein ACRAWC_06385 [Leifsonia sp. L25]|uniref:hypothetical protein n=1 Tax=Actinomycetes TaxID=1760 RepID=UPI003D69D9A0